MYCFLCMSEEHCPVFIFLLQPPPPCEILQSKYNTTRKFPSWVIDPNVWTCADKDAFPAAERAYYTCLFRVTCRNIKNEKKNL